MGFVSPIILLEISPTRRISTSGNLNLPLATRRKIRMCNVERPPERLLPACREHLAIFDAIIKRDAARHAMIQHLTNVRQGILETFGILLPDSHG